MKFVLCAVIWGSVALLCGGLSTVVQRAITVCSKDVSNSTYDDVFKKVQPTTGDGECLVECMMRESGLLLRDGLVNTTKLVEYLRRLSILDQHTDRDFQTMIRAINNCRDHKALSGDKCETAALFLQCTAKQAGKDGANQLVMSGVVHSFLQRRCEK